MEEMKSFAFARRERTERQLAVCNEETAQFGLALTHAEIQMLEERHLEVLQATGRVEFGDGVLPKLAQAFCDSPYMTQQNYAETLAELQEAFYTFKGEAIELLSDDELIEFMREHFDKTCEGSLAYLRDLTGEEICRRARFGDAMEDEPMEDEPIEEEESLWLD